MLSAYVCCLAALLRLVASSNAEDCRAEASSAENMLLQRVGELSRSDLVTEDLESGEGCYGEFSEPVVDEGNGIGVNNVATQSVDECKSACDAQEHCKSAVFCPEWQSCFLKDRQLDGSEATHAKGGGCQSLYKMPCVSPTQQARTTAGPSVRVGPTLSPTLETRHTKTYERSFTTLTLSFWRPRLFPGEYRVHHSMHRDKTVVVTKYSNGALSKPAHFVCKMSDCTSSGCIGSLWQAVPKAGYTCLSDVGYGRSHYRHAGEHATPDEIDSRFRCVHNSLLKTTELGKVMFSSFIPRRIGYLRVWSIAGWDGFRVGTSVWDVPAYAQKRLAAFTGGLYRDLVLIAAVDNPHDIDQKPVSYKLQQGMSSTRGSAVTLSAEIALEVSATASVGVGPWSGELSSTLTAKFGASTSFSSSDTSTDLSEITVSMNVPGKMRAELWQLVVKDSYEGPGSFIIKSHWFTISYSGL